MGPYGVGLTKPERPNRNDRIGRTNLTNGIGGDRTGVYPRGSCPDVNQPLQVDPGSVLRGGDAELPWESCYGRGRRSRAPSLWRGGPCLLSAGELDLGQASVWCSAFGIVCLMSSVRPCLLAAGDLDMDGSCGAVVVFRRQRQRRLLPAAL